MTNREALEAFTRNQQLDQATVRRLLEARLITASDVTNHDTPPGQREYLPISLTLKGQRLLDKAHSRDQKKRKQGWYRRTRTVLSRIEVKAAITVALGLCGLLLTYKYTGADDLRNKVYSPLNAEFSKIEGALNANSMTQPFTSDALSSLKQSGDFYRMPKSLQREVVSFYDDAGKIPGSVSKVTELLQRQFSSRIQALKSEQLDTEWRKAATARIQAQEQQQPGISAIRSFTFNHAFVGRAMDLRNPNNPVISGPGGPIWQINDWLAYP
jgi:hypothetical protein